MIDTIETWKAPKEVVVAIIDLALEHIKKVELNPEVETEGDNFDYWNSYDLGDGNYVDYNIHCGDDLGEINVETGQFEYYDSIKWSWDVACYAVNPPSEENKYHSIDTDREHYLFNYNKNGNKEVIFEN
ncbi:MAG: hypothetical protein CBC05_08610 [Crocinitomicaceae bacterium TMED45]|nr:MAG: hypothetical protein CBC05_08610 [Crocinitomicaceae bacterium TMED45]